MQLLTRPFLAAIRPEITQALAELGKKHGIAFSLGACRFSSTSATFKLDLALPSPGGEFEPPERRDFKAHAALWGMNPTDLDRTFTWNRETYTVSGLKPKARTNAIVVTNPQGKRYVMPASQVVLALQQGGSPVPPPQR